MLMGLLSASGRASSPAKRIPDGRLDDPCRVEVCDYRDIECAQQFDKIISIGMFEHLGKAFLPEYFKRAWQLLARVECF